MAENTIALLGRKIRRLEADGISYVLEQQVAVTKQSLGARDAEKHPRLDRALHLQANARRNVGVEGAFDDLAAGLLGCDHQVDAGSTGFGAETKNLVLQRLSLISVAAQQVGILVANADDTRN